MASERLYRYRCDGPGCDTEVIADRAPAGWLRILSRTGRGGLTDIPKILHGGPVPTVLVYGHGPAGNASAALPEGGHYCTTACLVQATEHAATKAHAQVSAKAGT